jgi:hypothetical protein
MLENHAMAFVGGAQALAVHFIGRCDSAGHTGSGGQVDGYRTA